MKIVKKICKIIFLICFYIEIVVSLITCIYLFIKFYKYAPGVLILFEELMKAEEHKQLYKDIEIYITIQIINLLIMFYINLIGHTIEYYTRKKQDKYFYKGINVTICCILLIIEAFKYIEIYYANIRDLQIELEFEIIAITAFILIISAINIGTYISFIMKEKKKRMGLNIEEDAKKSFDEFLNKKILNIKRYLSKIDFEVLDNLDIEWSKYCTEADIKRIKGQLDEYYNIQWLQFKDLTETEQDRLEHFESKVELENELFEKGIISEISTTVELEKTGVSREDYENVFTKIEMLEKSIWTYKRLKRIEDTLAVKPTVMRCYRLFLLSKKIEDKSEQKLKA